jgi:hypothetical protein
MGLGWGLDWFVEEFGIEEKLEENSLLMVEKLIVL